MKIQTRILNSDITEEHLQPSTPGSAGIDLRAVLTEDGGVGYLDIYPYDDAILIDTGIAIHINNLDYAAVILPRSGLLGCRGMVLGNPVGLIDSDYSGEIKISVWNRSKDIIRIRHLDRIAQLVVIPVTVPQFEIVSEFADRDPGLESFTHSKWNWGE